MSITPFEREPVQTILDHAGLTAVARAVESRVRALDDILIRFLTKWTKLTNSKSLSELIQIDGCTLHWFENRALTCTVLVYVDDATSPAIGGISRRSIDCGTLSLPFFPLKQLIILLCIKTIYKTVGNVISGRIGKNGYIKTYLRLKSCRLKMNLKERQSD